LARGLSSSPVSANACYASFVKYFRRSSSPRASRNPRPLRCRNTHAPAQQDQVRAWVIERGGTAGWGGHLVDGGELDAPHAALVPLAHAPGLACTDTRARTELALIPIGQEAGYSASGIRRQESGLHQQRALRARQGFFTCLAMPQQSVSAPGRLSACCPGLSWENILGRLDVGDALHMRSAKCLRRVQTRSKMPRGSPIPRTEHTDNLDPRGRWWWGGALQSRQATTSPHFGSKQRRERSSPTRRGVPEADGAVGGAGGDERVVRRHRHAVDVLLVRPPRPQHRKCRRLRVRRRLAGVGALGLAQVPHLDRPAGGARCDV
jgi:hypothetical protein